MALGLQISQSMSYLYTLGPKVGIVYIPAALPKTKRGLNIPQTFIFVQDILGHSHGSSCPDELTRQELTLEVWGPLGSQQRPLGNGFRDPDPSGRIPKVDPSWALSWGSFQKLWAPWSEVPLIRIMFCFLRVLIAQPSIAIGSTYIYMYIIYV